MQACVSLLNVYSSKKDFSQQLQLLLVYCTFLHYNKYESICVCILPYSLSQARFPFWVSAETEQQRWDPPASSEPAAASGDHDMTYAGTPYTRASQLTARGPNPARQSSPGPVLPPCGQQFKAYVRPVRTSPSGRMKMIGGK